jgi:hypothetical protein
VLTPATLDANLLDRDAEFQRYKENSKAEITWIETILADLNANASNLITNEEL